MDISIIIVNYNTPQLVLQCLNSIKLHTRGCYETIVVDNASTDDSVTCLSALGKEITLVQSTENIGFGKANNLGVRHSSGKYLLFLNPDTILCNDAIGKLQTFLESSQNIGAVGGNLFDEDNRPTHSFSRLFPGILQEMDFALMQAYTRIRYGRNRQFNHTRHPLKVAFVTGADLMMRRTVFEEVGGFDKDFFMYYEDTALCYSLTQLGYTIWSVPSAKIIHLEGKSLNYSAAREERIQKGRSTYFHKIHGRYYNRIADILNLITLRAAITITKLLHKPQRHQKYATRLKIYRKYADC